MTAGRQSSKRGKQPVSTELVSMTHADVLDSDIFQLDMLVKYIGMQPSAILASRQNDLIDCSDKLYEIVARAVGYAETHK